MRVLNALVTAYRVLTYSVTYVTGVDIAVIIDGKRLMYVLRCLVLWWWMHTGVSDRTLEDLQILILAQSRVFWVCIFPRVVRDSIER